MEGEKVDMDLAFLKEFSSDQDTLEMVEGDYLFTQCTSFKVISSIAGMLKG